MLDAKVHLCPRRGVGSELVGDHDARRRAGGLEDLRHEPARRAAVSSTLNQNVEHEAVLIYRTPQPIWLSGDRNDDLASRAGESHPHALPEPYVTLSSHTAPDVRPFACRKRQWAKR